MDDAQKLKNIVAAFLKVEPETIHPGTRMDKTAIKGSVMIHRMYTVMERQGFKTSNRHEIHTFADLLENLGGAPVKDKDAPSEQTPAGGTGIGIDLEAVKNMPETGDFRGHEFYADNFSAAEISYCTLQPDAYACFAGKFAAKEAVVKADNAFRGMRFCDIEIGNDAHGRPVFRDFLISITHQEEWAAAVAVRPEAFVVAPAVDAAPPQAAPDRARNASLTFGNLLILTAAVILFAAGLSLMFWDRVISKIFSP